MTITTSQMTDGSHTFKIRLVEEVNREVLFYRVLSVIVIKVL
jgi:hypothetical protein